MTDCGASFEFDRCRNGSCVSILASFRIHQRHSLHVDSGQDPAPTLSGLAGLLASIGGVGSSSLVTASCASSSISVPSVPFEFVGEGSTCCGYGDGGGARLSD